MSRITKVSRTAISSLVFGALIIGTQFMGGLPVFAGAYLTLDAFSGTPGTSLGVSGGGWTPGDTINLYVGSKSGTPIGTATVGQDSTFTSTVVVPASAPQGPLAIIGVDASTSYEADNSYYVVPLSTTIAVTAPSHAPYATVQVSGTGFAPNEGITLSLGTATASTTATASGSFSGTIVVPMVTSNLYHITATGASSGASSFDYFWIDAFYPNASPSTYYLMPGATLAFTGSGFAPGELVNITQTGSTTPVSSFTADATGSFSTAGGFAIPAADHGQSATFTLTGSKSGVSASTNVTVGDYYAYASPASYYLLPGQTETFTGGGFMANELVNVYVGASTTPATTFTTDAFGSFTNAGSVLVPFGSASQITFNLKGQMSLATASASTGVGQYFASLSPSAYFVNPNTDITVTGAGYAPNEAVVLTVNGNTASSTVATTTTLGSFTAPVRIPFGAGSATVLGVGSLSQASSSVTVALAKFYPGITPSSYFAYPGSKISFKGTGFVPGETVTTTLGSASSTTAVADQYGNVQTATSTVPFSSTGTLVATINGSLSQSQTSLSIAVGTLSPYLSAENYSSTQGGNNRIQGFSFAPGETVNVSAGSFSTTTIADENGTTPLVAITLPYKVSSLRVTFTGASSAVTASTNVSLQSYYASLGASSYYTKPGSTVTITGAGFAPNESVQVGNGAATTTATATATGSFTTSLTLPFTTNSSTQVVATGLTSGAGSSLAIAFAPFVPQVSPSTYYTLPGTTVTFTGTGYAPNEQVAVGFNGTAVTTISADANGGFSYDYTIPFNATTATASFVGQTTGAGIADTISLATYAAYISLSNYYGIGGSAEVVSGSGFAPNELVTLIFNGTPFATTHASAKGVISLSTNIPYSVAGNMPITAVGANSGVKAGTSLTVAAVYPSFMLGNYAGAPGSSVNLIGSNFFPNETVYLTTDRSGSTPVATFTTDASGAFNTSSYKLPAGYAEGTLVLTVEGMHSLTAQSITYYVTGK